MLFRQQSGFRRRNGNRPWDKSEVGSVCAEVFVLTLRKLAPVIYVRNPARICTSPRSLFHQSEKMLVHVEKSSHFGLAGVCSSKRRNFAGGACRCYGFSPRV